MAAEVPALRLKKITKVYPGAIALKEVDLEVVYGEVHGLIGKNGAGKSTLVGIIAGLIQPTVGVIQIKGRTFSSLTRAQAKREGIAIVTQEPEVILDVSVAENLFLGSQLTSFGLVNQKEMFRKTERLLADYGLDIPPNYRAGDLSLSERQLLLILKACAAENANIVILDEASAPLTPKDTQVLQGMVKSLRNAGKAIVYISHHIDELLGACDRLTVLRDGGAIATRSGSDLTRKSLSELIVGEPLRAGTSRSGPVGDETLLRLSAFTKWGAFESVDLTVRRGEIVGLAGLRGSGRTELMKAVAGIAPADEGAMTFKGSDAWFAAPVQALRAGIAYLPEEREAEGLIKGFSIRDNLALNCLRALSVYGVIQRGECVRLAEEVFKAVECKAFSTEQDVDELSGGNKQKVLIGRIMALKPDLYLLDEPTRGVDIGAKASILSLIKENIRGHAGALVSSPGLDDLIEICDRILVMRKGRVVARHDRAYFEERSLFIEMQGQALSPSVPPGVSVTGMSGAWQATNSGGLECLSV
ncbi:MAG: sugar ABC transporter ATP-binding protein [Synergistaceae bacterium]|jgi:ABC-type sugar transport system ATPase subunit|nr:sugar ABC transporter ATP-binding protein [Synergistaceae bacterium]